MATPQGTIFINYRKDDSNWNALALYNDLQKYFSKDQLFKDFNAIRPGDDFMVSIENALAKCNVLLVIIGKNWLNAKNADGSLRIQDPDDFVRLEISTALDRGVQVIPVLFDGTAMPKAEDLPENLRPLCRRQFVEIDPKRFEDDVRNLAEAIKQVLPKSDPGPGPIPRPIPPKPSLDNERDHLEPVPLRPDNNLVWAIACTLLCCLPLGIVSIIHAVKVNDLYASHKYTEAQTEARKAKQFAIYGVVAGIIVYIIYFVLYSLGTIGQY